MLIKLFLVFLFAGIIFLPLHVKAAALVVGISTRPDTIAPGGLSEIRWSAQGNFPITCTILGDDGWAKSYVVTPETHNGVETVSPTVTTTYRLECTDVNGNNKSDTDSVVISAVPTVYLSASPDALPDAGGTVYISWDVALADSCRATDGDSTWRNMSGLSGGGSLPWTLSQTMTFSLECSNAAGESSGKKSVVVAVGAADLCGNNIVNSGEQCDEGAKNDDTCLKSGCSETCQWLGGQICSSVCGNGRIDVLFNPSCSGDGCYEACDNGDGNGICPSLCSTSCQPNNCVGGMTLRINASPSAVEAGKPTTISWTTTNAVSCSVSGAGLLGNVEVSGSRTVLVESPPETYHVTCTDKHGQTVDKSVQIIRKKAPTGDHNGDLKDYAKIDVHSAAPNYIPFGGGEVTVRYKVGKVDSVRPIPNTLQCSLNHGHKLVTPTEVINKIAVNVGKNNQVTYSFEGDYIDEMTPLGKDNAAGVTITYKCSAVGYEGEISATVYVAKQSDPAKAPEMLFFAPANKNVPKMDSDSSTLSVSYDPAVSSGLAANFGVLGADRCEANGWTFPAVKPGNAYFFDGSGTRMLFRTNSPYSPVNTFTFECWNGQLSTKKTIIVNIVGSPIDDDDDDSGSSCLVPNVCQAGGCQQGYSVAAGACGNAGAVCCQQNVVMEATFSFFNPLQFNTLEGVLMGALTALQGIIVILAIIFTIIGAVMYITAAGNEGRLILAKGAITAALIGLALALATPSFLKEIAAILGWQNIIDASNTISGAKTFVQIAEDVLNFLLSIVGILGIIMMVVGGILYLTSAGDEGKTETGKKIVKYSVIGIAIALAALILVTQVAKFFS